MVIDQPRSLKHSTVLVTRPAHQAQSLCDGIESLNGKVVRFPAIEIRACSISSPLPLKLWDLVLWTSANAVSYCPTELMDFFLQHPIKHIPIGSATSQALQSAGLTCEFVPKAGTTSEGLLKTLKARFDLEKASTLIIKGQGGRETLSSGLALCQTVDSLNVYQRCLPSTKPLSSLNTWLEAPNPIAIATSSEALRNLLKLMPNKARPLFMQSPLITVSERTKQEAIKLGFTKVVLARSASDQDLTECLLNLIQNC